MTKIIDMTGQTIGRWTVLQRGAQTPGGQTTWTCVCECGAEKDVTAILLRDGRSRSCGCLKSELTVARSTRHGHSNSVRVTPTYHSWAGMIQRCTNPQSSRWKDYGGRGITVCERWMTFADFLADMGVKPPRTSIERTRNDVGYEPGNCTWATSKTQSRNKRNNVLIEADGIKLSKAEWAERLGISPATINDRLRAGWDEAEAVTTPKLVTRGADRNPRGPLSQKHRLARRG